jgi:MFS family permease
VRPGLRHIPSWLRDLGSGGPRALLAWQAVTSAVGIFLATALMALYLVGPAHLSPRSAALTLLVSGALTLVATPMAGRVIRALGPRRFAIASCLSRGVVFLLLPLSTRAIWVVGVVLLLGLSEAAAFSVYQLVIADALNESARTEALAVRRTLGNVGFTLGGLVVGVVVGVGSRAAYAFAFVASGIALLLASLFLLPLAEPERTAEVSPGSEPDTRPRSALRDAHFVGLVAAATVLASSLNLLTVGVPLWVVHRTRAPHGIVGLLLVTNTLLVVALQVRLAREAATWWGARRSITRAGAWFAGSAALIAVAAKTAAWAAVALLMVAAVTAAMAEMWDSAGWWTISYEYPRPDERPDYLAAFDVVTPAVTILGPPMMIAIVSHGSVGWSAYAALLLLASGLVRTLTRHGPPRPRSPQSGLRLGP